MGVRFFPGRQRTRLSLRGKAARVRVHAREHVREWVERELRKEGMPIPVMDGLFVDYLCPWGKVFVAWHKTEPRTYSVEEYR